MFKLGHRIKKRGGEIIMDNQGNTGTPTGGGGMPSEPTGGNMPPTGGGMPSGDTSPDQQGGNMPPPPSAPQG